MFSLGGALIGLQNAVGGMNVNNYAQGYNNWRVGADQGFWSQPGIDKTRRWGSDKPPEVTKTMGERGLAQDLPKLGAPQPAMATAQPMTQGSQPQRPRPFNSLAALSRVASQRG